MNTDRDRSHRSALWLSTMLTLAGSCGACNGAQVYAYGPPPSADLLERASGPGAREAAELSAAIAVTVLDADHRRPIAAANLVVSLMLVVGSFMLGSRSKNARWFIVNALAANLVWIVADAGFSIARVEARRTVLARAITKWMLAIETPPPPLTSAQAHAWSHGWITVTIAGLVTAAIVKLAFHAYLIVKTRSEAISQFLEERPRE